MKSRVLCWLIAANAALVRLMPCCLLLVLLVECGGGCRLPTSQEPRALENAGLGKNLRPKGESVGTATGLDARTREIESNLGYR
ncbi:MAG: hypothetical protein U0905_16965 [Pirellulales bacterium]